MTRLIIWRHGQTAWNAERRVQGQTDVDLTDTGRRQAAYAAKKLAEFKPNLIIASDLRRAADTAAALAAVTGLSVTLDSRLRERCFGPWQGHLVSELASGWPTEYARWRAGHEPELNGIERTEEIAARAALALGDATAAANGGLVVIATHGGTARHGIAALLGWPESILRTFGGLGNCHWSELRHSTLRGWQLWSHNVS